VAGPAASGSWPVSRAALMFPPGESGSRELAGMSPARPEVYVDAVSGGKISRSVGRGTCGVAANGRMDLRVYGTPTLLTNARDWISSGGGRVTRESEVFITTAPN